MCLSWVYQYLPCEDSAVLAWVGSWEENPCLEQMLHQKHWYDFLEVKKYFYFMNHDKIIRKHCPDSFWAIEEFLERWKLKGEIHGLG